MPRVRPPVYLLDNLWWITSTFAFFVRPHTIFPVSSHKSPLPLPPTYYCFLPTRHSSTSLFSSTPQMCHIPPVRSFCVYTDSYTLHDITLIHGDVMASVPSCFSLLHTVHTPILPSFPYTSPSFLPPFITILFSYFLLTFFFFPPYLFPRSMTPSSCLYSSRFSTFHLPSSPLTRLHTMFLSLSPPALKPPSGHRQEPIPSTTTFPSVLGHQHSVQLPAAAWIAYNRSICIV